VPAKAMDTGQPFLAASAFSWNVFSSMPGTLPSVSSSMVVILNPSRCAHGRPCGCVPGHILPSQGSWTGPWRSTRHVRLRSALPGSFPDPARNGTQRNSCPQRPRCRASSSLFHF
jgi:hypothetical protein